MENNSNSIPNTDEDGKNDLELISKKLENLSEKQIKKEDREFILRINLSKNQFYEITDVFLDFRNLVSLDMTENYIENITNLYFLVNLEILMLAKNFISKIGNVLSSLQKLQFLDLSFNKIIVDDVLIKTLSQNKNLFSLSLRGNINYNFEKVKNWCLEFTDNLEMLDTLVIYHKKSEKVIFNNTVDYKTKKGENFKIKTLKDYMKIRLKDIEQNEHEKLYDEEENNNYNIRKNFRSNVNFERPAAYLSHRSNNILNSDDRKDTNKNEFNQKDDYIENLKNKKGNKILQPKSFYYYSNIININQFKK